MFTLKNIVLYLIIGGIIYLAVYFLWIAKKGSYRQTNTTMTVTLNAQNASGEMGTATLTDVNGKTKVRLSLTGMPMGVPQPAHIHVGACPNPGAVKYPLTNVVNGTSETVLNLPLAQLQQKLPLAMNIHKSAAESKIYVACGDIGGAASSSPASAPGY